MKKFEPYEGWEQDLEHVVTPRYPAIVSSSVINGCARLFAAFKEATCGKILRHGWGRGQEGSAMWYRDGSQLGVPLTCNLPEGHSGPHAPDVDQEAWR